MSSRASAWPAFGIYPAVSLLRALGVLCPQFSLQLQDEGEESEARRGEAICLHSWTEDLV